MILITSQFPDAFAGACVDEDGDHYWANEGCRPNLDPDDNDPCDPNPNAKTCLDALKFVGEIENLKDDVKAIQALAENNKDAKKLMGKLDKVFKALNPPDKTPKHIEKLLKDTNNLLEKEKITTDEHNALVTVIPTGNDDNINAVLAEIILSDKDLEKLTKTIDKLNDEPVPNVAKACKELDGFKKEVNKHFDKDKLTETEKDVLIGAAEVIKTSIGCA